MLLQRRFLLLFVELSEHLGKYSRVISCCLLHYLLMHRIGWTFVKKIKKYIFQLSCSRRARFSRDSPETFLSDLPWFLRKDNEVVSCCLLYGFEFRFLLQDRLLLKAIEQSAPYFSYKLRFFPKVDDCVIANRPFIFCEYQGFLGNIAEQFPVILSIIFLSLVLAEI